MNADSPDTFKFGNITVSAGLVDDGLLCLARMVDDRGQRVVGAPEVRALLARLGVLYYRARPLIVTADGVSIANDMLRIADTRSDAGEALLNTLEALHGSWVREQDLIRRR